MSQSEHSVLKKADDLKNMYRVYLKQNTKQIIVVVRKLRPVEGVQAKYISSCFI